jgi:hypothetical protein
MLLSMLSHQHFQKLTTEQEGPLVSLYVPFTNGGQANENGKRLELMLSEAEVRLAALGLSAKGCTQFLAPARAYAEERVGSPQEGKTLALLLSPSEFHAYTLPAEVPQCLQVNAHFCVAPLLPYLHKHADCYVLAVSKKRARLLHVDGAALHEVQVDGMPGSFDEAFEGLEHQDKELQSHSGGAGGPMFHGQGGAHDLAKEELEEFLHKIAKAVDHTLSNQKAPLFFSGIEEELGMFRKYSSYPQLQAQSVAGKPDVMSAEEIVGKAVELMRPLWKKEREVALEVYGPLAGTGRTSVDPQAVLDLSYHGKVDGLLVAEGAMLWGKINPDSGIAEIHESAETGDIDLVGLAAVHTLQHRGWVRAIEPEAMPEGSMMAAVLRY